MTSLYSLVYVYIYIYKLKKFKDAKCFIWGARRMNPSHPIRPKRWCFDASSLWSAASFRCSCSLPKPYSSSSLPSPQIPGFCSAPRWSFVDSSHHPKGSCPLSRAGSASSSHWRVHVPGDSCLLSCRRLENVSEGPWTRCLSQCWWDGGARWRVPGCMTRPWACQRGRVSAGVSGCSGCLLSSRIRSCRQGYTEVKIRGVCRWSRGEIEMIVVIN